MIIDLVTNQLLKKGKQMGLIYALFFNLTLQKLQMTRGNFAVGLFFGVGKLHVSVLFLLPEFPMGSSQLNTLHLHAELSCLSKVFV